MASEFSGNLRIFAKGPPPKGLNPYTNLSLIIVKALVTNMAYVIISC